MAPLKIRLRSTDPRLIALPWERPLGEWDPALFVALEVGPSRNLVRFFDGDDGRYALKELDSRWAQREWRVLRRCADAGVPAVPAVGLVDRGDGLSVVITRAIRGTDSYRQILGSADQMRLEPLVDALALLLVELHRAGVYWGDATLANTLLSRDGDGLVAMLVDGETGEVYPDGLSDGRRAEDLALCVERVAHGLVDLSIAREEPRDDERFIEIAGRLESRYRELWRELTEETRIDAGDVHALSRRVRRLEELGFAVREIHLRPDGEGFELRVATGRRRALAERLARLTGVETLEGQARLLIGDLELHRAWLSSLRGHDVELADAASHWRAERFEPAIARLTPLLDADESPIQALCELLDRKWHDSERAGHDIGLRASIDAWLAERAGRR